MEGWPDGSVERAFLVKKTGEDGSITTGYLLWDFLNGHFALDNNFIVVLNERAELLCLPVEVRAALLHLLLAMHTGEKEKTKE